MQSTKALSPTEQTESGISMLSIFLHSANALFPIRFTDIGIVVEFVP